MKEASYSQPTQFMSRCVKFIPPDTGILEWRTLFLRNTFIIPL